MNELPHSGTITISKSHRASFMAKRNNESRLLAVAKQVISSSDLITPSKMHLQSDQSEQPYASTRVSKLGNVVVVPVEDEDDHVTHGLHQHDGADSKVAGSTLPSDRLNQVYMDISALEAGYIHLPEREFITPNDPIAVHRCPSLAFYLFHPPTGTKIVYDLGLRRDVENYPPKVHKQFIDGKRTVEIPVDVKESLERGKIQAEDIDIVVVSHMHYDHTGNPDQFPCSKFIVGPGSLALLELGASDPQNTWYLPSLLPSDEKRIVELPYPSLSSKWKPLGYFPHSWDLFGDGSFYIINAPGHVNGHLNGMARVGPSRFILLGSDSCHFPSLLEGSCCIAHFEQEPGVFRSVHVDDEAAKTHIKNLRKMRDLSEAQVEVVLAHDLSWAEKNQDKFLPGHL